MDNNEQIIKDLARKAMKDASEGIRRTSMLEGTLLGATQVLKRAQLMLFVQYMAAEQAAGRSEADLYKALADLAPVIIEAGHELASDLAKNGPDPKALAEVVQLLRKQQ